MDEEWMTTTPRVLSVQSHVVHGYVGNRAAVFPLQLLGFDVDCVNTCQFANHSGYPLMTGTRVSAEELDDLWKCLKQNKIAKYSHILTGYQSDVKFLKKLADIIRDVKAENQGVIYLCDPVLGDNGAYYVPEELKTEFIENLIPLCDIVTPNQFELGELTGIDVSTEKKALLAIDKLHDLGVESVVLTSATFEDQTQKISCIGSVRKQETERFKIEVSKLDISVTGSGDLFASTLLAWNTRLRSLRDAVVRAINTVHAVIDDTMLYSKTVTDIGQPSVAKKELRIIENRHSIIDPPSKFFPEMIP